MIILSSPSGAGKTTLVKLLSERKGLITSISHTTRKPRSNEVNGKDYHFVTNDVFKKMINKQEKYRTNLNHQISMLMEISLIQHFLSNFSF